MYTKEQQQQKGSGAGVGGPVANESNPFGGDHRPANGGSNVMMEDERDPDVIPAQFGNNY